MSDLIIKDKNDETHRYVLDSQSPKPHIHTASPPNVPLNTAMSTPTNGGGQYDVRDTEGDKAITHLEWAEGAGQLSLDGPDSAYSRYWESKNINIQQPGKLSLLKANPATAVAGTCGPVFSVNGTIWMGQDSGALKYSTDDGATWSSATLTDATDASIDSFCTDGSRVFFCVSGSATAAYNGLWANTVATPGTFAKYGSTKTTEKITHLAHQGGYLFACVAASAGLIDKTTGVYTAKTPAFLNDTNTSVALVSAGNAVYWIVSQGGRSYVYELSYDPTSSSMNTEQFIELQSQFIATCAIGYLSSVYIGGYFSSVYDAVGRGGVYVCATNQSYMAPLFELGEYPEDTAVPTALENDNRVYALCEAGRDLYVLTNRAVYRWDIDDGGYSHVCDFEGCGTAERSLVWNTSSLLSWNGTDLTTVPHPNFHPNGWTVTDDDVTHWTFVPLAGFVPAYAKYAGTGSVWTCVPPTTGNADPVMANATGATLEFVTPDAMTGRIEVTMRDGTREAKWTINPTSILMHQYTQTTQVHTWDTYESFQGGYNLQTQYTGYRTVHHSEVVDTGNWLWSNETPAAGETLKNNSLWSTTLPGKVVTCILQGVESTMRINGTGGTSNMTKADASANLITVEFFDGAAVSTMTFQVGVAAPQTGSSTFRPSITRHNGKLVAPYYSKRTGSAVVGRMITSALYNTEGRLTQSGSSFHTGSMRKDFRYLTISHEPLPGNTSLEGMWTIDGQVGTAAGIAYRETETRIPINLSGFHVQTAVVLRSSDGLATPIVKGINLVWNFVKVHKHVYVLNCSSGADAGRWSEDPADAINFLFSTADERADFTDKFVGAYSGFIESLQYEQAAASLSEGPSGVVTISVMEEI